MIVLLPNKAGPKGACERFTASSMVRNTLVQIKTRLSRDDQVDYVHCTRLVVSNLTFVMGILSECQRGM